MAANLTLGGIKITLSPQTISMRKPRLLVKETLFTASGYKTRHLLMPRVIAIQQLYYRY